MPDQRPRLADRVSAARRRSFVGRSGELELFRQAVEAPGEPPFTVLHVHGPGGIGKTALLRMYRELAADAGVDVLELDARDLPVDREAVRAAVTPVADGPRRPVLLVDSYELLAPLDGWLRDELLPTLPGDVVVVLAGRRGPAAGWTADPGWRGLCRMVPLGPFTRDEAARYLERAPLGERERELVLTSAAGHPLVLALAAELAGSGDVPDRLAAPDVVGALVARIVDAAPGPRHERALHLCARARATTVTLLREVLDEPDAGDLFEWLRVQPSVEAGPAGLRPHDAVREVLLRDLRWRDAAAADRLDTAYQLDVLRRIRSAPGPAQEDGLLDAVYDSRHQPGLRDYYDWDTFGAVDGGPAVAGDRADVASLVAGHLAPDEARAVLGWFDLDPGACVVYRQDGRVQGAVLRLALHTAPRAAVRADPVTAAAWAWAERLGRRDGDRVMIQRCALDRDAGHGPAPSFNIACKLGVRDGVAAGDAAFDLMAAPDPDYLGPFCELIGFGRVATTGPAGAPVAVHGVDWRRGVPTGWWDTLAPPRPRAELPPTGFGEGVRSALRDVHRPDRLDRSPLLGAGVARDGAGLREALLRAVQELGGHPRDEKLRRVLDRTYLRPAPTQEKAAEVLGLPSSTYRRHLASGVARVGEALWAARTEREVSGSRSGR